MLDIGVRGLEPDAFLFDDLREQLHDPHPLRIFAIAQAIRDGIGVDEIHELTRIDRWFLHALEPVVEMHGRLARSSFPLPVSVLRDVKRLGFSDEAVGKLTGAAPEAVRAARKSAGIESHFPQIDTMAGEFPADTNYLYATYHADSSDAAPSQRKEGPDTRIRHLPDRFERRVRLVCRQCRTGGRFPRLRDHHAQLQPETVSTDYDVCDRLYFDEISFETVLDLYEHERPKAS